MLDFSAINRPNKHLSYDNENSFLRSVIVGVSNFMFDTLYIPTRKGSEREIEMVNIPVYYSLAGNNNYQAIIDLYSNSDKDCNKKCLSSDGTIGIIPSGIFSISNGITINSASALAKYERVSYFVEEKNEWGNKTTQENSTARWIDISMNINFKFRCSTNSERFKLWECFTRTYYNARKFWIRYDGVERIPVILKFSDSTSMGFKSPNFPIAASDDYSEMEVSMELYTIMPIFDPYEKRSKSNIMEIIKTTI